MEESSSSASEQVEQSADTTSLGAREQSNETTTETSEGVAQSTESAITETETTEDMEDTGQVVSAATPEADDTTTQSTTAADVESKGKKLYENNQYDNYTEANSSAYEEIAEDEVELSDGKNKQYEIQVEGNDGSATLIYDEKGELIKADKGM